MDLNVAKEIAALQRLSMNDLRARYADSFGEATRANHRAWLVRRIAWRLQALAEGDLSERARQRAAELANDADLRLSPPRERACNRTTLSPLPTVAVSASGDARLPLPGTILTRRYKGAILQVQVRGDGFDYDGQVYRSLSAVAKAITGTHTNGFLFFKGALNQQGGDR